MKKIKFFSSVFFSLALITVLLFIFGAGWLYQMMASHQVENYVLPSPEAGRVMLVHANRELGESSLVVLEGKVEIELIGGYGKYPLGSVWPLMALDERPSEFVRAVYGFIFHQPVAQVVVLPALESAKPNTWSIQRALWRQVFSPNLTFSSRLALIKTSLILRAHPLKSVTSLSHPDELLTLVETDQSAFKLQANDCGLAILNASELSGLANRFRQLIELNQGYVVRVDDATQNLPQTMLVVDVQKGDSCDQTAQLINQLLPFPVTLTRANDVYTTYRTPLALLLGEDLAQTWSGSL